MIKTRFPTLLLAIALATGGTPLQAQDTAPTKSGYTQGASLETGDSVTEDLELDDIDVGSVLRFPRFEKFFEPWFETKRKLNENYGLKLQFSQQALYQFASESSGETEAAGGRSQIQGTWTILGRGTKTPGLLSFRYENRYKLGTAIPPTKLASQFGSLVPSGTGFSDFGSALTELAWRQTLLDGRMKFIFGKISAIAWYNGHALSSSLRGFQNTAMQSSLTKPVVGRGFGIGGAYEVTPHFIVLGGIHDANASTPDNPFDTIDAHEYYKSAEFRWHPTTPDRRRWDQVRLQFWHQEELKGSGTPAGQGVTFVASRIFDDKWMPFVLGGISDGDASLFEADLVVGLGVGFNTKHRAARDVLGIAAGWGRPSNNVLQDQYTSEVFYRFQLVERLAITPSVQLVVNPAANPKEDKVFVAGLRIRLTF